MRSTKLPRANRARLLVLLPLLLGAAGCGKPVPPPVLSIALPAADVQAVIEPKPKPPVTIVTDDAAAARYSADVELWGERISRAGARICRSLASQGVALGFGCPGR